MLFWVSWTIVQSIDHEKLHKITFKDVFFYSYINYAVVCQNLPIM